MRGSSTPMRGGMMQGAMLKDSGAGSAWMHAGQGNFPRICVGLLCLCVGVKLVGESGSHLNKSKRELERELVGQGGFPRICVDFPRLCVVRRGKGATPRLDQGSLGVDGSLLSTHMRPLPRICVELILRFASKLRFLLCKLPFFIFREEYHSNQEDKSIKMLMHQRPPLLPQYLPHRGCDANSLRVLGDRRPFEERLKQRRRRKT
ncbi:hypothetical protein PIB30_074359 [Stylosanthes scabra]|uniref:Uncharacterized protein n=1 Tax=Stylosanthes scabra TaxID=79078 RepID=A0ABU6VPP0_9FABA|nr:hypothetical protein [Stylosanthes scabra]